MRKRAAVAFSFEAMGKLLHLRDGLSVIAAKVDVSEETIEFFVTGEGLPSLGRREQVARVPLSELSDWELR